MTQRPINKYDAYHAHVYFDESTLDSAILLGQRAAERFDIPMGRVHQKRVGPHPHWSYQLTFDSTHFDRLMPWLEAHRGDLTILIHGLTGDDLADHTDHVAWLGKAAPLDLSVFSLPESEQLP
jgi:aromatic ring-cleaving dioxygenase